MPFLKLMRTTSSVPIWVNSNQITTITAQRSFGSTFVYSEVWTSDGIHIDIDMTPEQLLKAIEDANATPTLIPQPGATNES